MTCVFRGFAVGVSHEVSWFFLLRSAPARLADSLLLHPIIGACQMLSTLIILRVWPVMAGW
jgi:hypothetical protein